MSSAFNLTKEDYQCRHIFPDGHRCGSPRMRDEDRCYYHHETRGPIHDLNRRRELRGTFAPLPPASFSNIQENLDQVLVRLASNDLDLRRAGLLLYCLQIASTNLHHARKAKQQEQPATTPIAEVQEHLELQEQDAEVEEPTTDNRNQQRPSTNQYNRSQLPPLSPTSAPQPIKPGTRLNEQPATNNVLHASTNNEQQTTNNVLHAARYRPRIFTIRQCCRKASTASPAKAGESNRTST